MKSSNLILKNGFVLDIRNQIIEKKDIFIQNGIIVDKIQDGKILDVSGKWLIPPLNDMHVHARGQNSGTDIFEPMTPYEEAKIFLNAGVLRFLDAMNDEKVIFEDRKRNPHILCSGAAFTPTKGHGTEYNLPSSSYRIVDTPNDALAQILDIQKYNPDVIKIMYDHRGFDGETIEDGQEGALGIAMKKEVMEALIAACQRFQLKPYVHLGVWKDAEDAILAGAKIINHLDATPIPDSLVQLAQKNSIYWIPTLTMYEEYLNLLKQPELLNDPLLKKVASKKVINSYMPKNVYRDPDYIEFQKRYETANPASIKKLKNAGVKIVAGSDSIELGTFIGWSLHRELFLLVQYGLTEWEALASATINAGDMLGKKWDLEIGSEGNILVLNENPVKNIWNTTKINKVILA